MPHSPEIINHYINELKKDYDLNNGDYSILIEKRLIYSNLRIMSDIQIIKNGILICVVEIGLTRPNKIRIYEELNISDIRWVENSPGDFKPLISLKDKLINSTSDNVDHIPISISMIGHIRTLQKCPYCEKSFPNSFICPTCGTSPTRFFVDLWIGKRLKIYSDIRGIPLKSYFQAEQVLMAIRHQITQGIFKEADWKRHKKIPRYVRGMSIR